MQTYRSNFISLFLILILSFPFFQSCREAIADEVPEPETVAFPNVHADLQLYFARFESEGAERGLSIDLAAAEIEGIIKDLAGEHIAGQCSYGFNMPRLVTIDPEFWESAGDLSREFIVFHELGHCYLDRDHREDRRADGTCVSLMRSGTLDCRDNYNNRTREVYLDELFEESLVQ